MWPLGIIALIVGSALWVLGARYTLEGLITVGNLLLELIGIPARLPRPSGWYWLLAAVPGLLYSLVEVWFRPGPAPRWASVPNWLISLLLVALIHASDVGSTFAGYLFPPAGAWALHTWAATDGRWLLFIWAIILTYLPERLIILGLQWTGVGRWIP
jgi:hypothetical protein